MKKSYCMSSLLLLLLLCHASHKQFRCHVLQLHLGKANQVCMDSIKIAASFMRPKHVLPMQVFRTEHYSHAIKASKTTGTIGLMAIIVYTVAALSLVCAAIAHPAEMQSAFLHPRRSLSLLASPDFPWTQIAFTGLLSTDFVIYIEVSQQQCCLACPSLACTGLCLHDVS